MSASLETEVKSKDSLIICKECKSVRLSNGGFDEWIVYNSNPNSLYSQTLGKYSRNIIDGVCPLCYGKS